MASVAVNTDVVAECGNCGVEERLLLHHVGHRGTFRRLCTACVLRLHPQSFCPTCFQVYPVPPPPPSDAVYTCVKCYSVSHHRCVAEGKTPPPPSKPYTCPLCAAPNAPIFKLKIAKGIRVESGEGLSPKMEECRVVDADAAKKLLAAAKIASLSMNKAAAAAKIEAERRAREAAFTRKRARDALEHLANLVKKDKLRKKESLAAPAIGGGTVLGMQNLKPDANENAYGNGHGKLANDMISFMDLDTGIKVDGSRDAVDHPSLLSASLNAVTETREDEKIDDLAASVGDLVGESDDELAIEFDENEDLMFNAVQDAGISDSKIDFLVSNDMQNGSHDVSMEEEQPQ